MIAPDDFACHAGFRTSEKPEPLWLIRIGQTYHEGVVT